MDAQLENRIYTTQQIADLDLTRLPTHIAIIPDGNRRWAKERGATAIEGQRHGADTLMDTVKAAKELGIKVITFYVFSTENWMRDPLEVQALLWLIQNYLESQRQEMVDNGVKLDYIGDLSRFPASMKAILQKSKEATAAGSDIEMILALNYGSRNEMTRALQALLNEVKLNQLQIDDLNEEMISQYLDTAKWVDPDLIIRTSGEFRMSNFLLWQSSYSEFYKTDVLWPDFSSEHLLEAILDFQTRQRRKGAS